MDESTTNRNLLRTDQEEASEPTLKEAVDRLREVLAKGVIGDATAARSVVDRYDAANPTWTQARVAQAKTWREVEGIDRTMIEVLFDRSGVMDGCATRSIHSACAFLDRWQEIQDEKCDRCQGTGKVGICTCHESPPCSGCTEPVGPDDDYEPCPDCQPSGRALELADRLTAPGQPGKVLSASEFHEVAAYLRGAQR